MSTCVCVLSNNGERLMPTFRLGKVRRLLKDGKAKIVKHHPFTIQLLYDSKTNTQPIEICEACADLIVAAAKAMQAAEK